MNNGISAIRILPAEVDPASTRAPASKDGFAGTFRDALAEVDRLQSQANQQVTGMLEGTGTEVHKAMIAVEKADLAFQLMLQVRNKIVQAYQEVSRLQF